MWPAISQWCGVLCFRFSLFSCSCTPADLGGEKRWYDDALRGVWGSRDLTAWLLRRSW